MFIGSANRITRAENLSLMLSPAMALELRAATLDPRLTFTRASAGTDIIDGLVVGFASDAPRISTSNGLLMEESRTNIARYSETLDNTPWTFAVTRASRSIIAGLNPMGVSVNVPILVEDGQNGVHEWRPTFTGIAASTTYTASLFIKPNGRNFMALSFQSAGTPTLSGTAVFDIAGGSIVSAGTLNPVIVACANGWYRIAITGTTGTGATALEFKINLYSSGVTSSYTGDGASGVQVWGAQLEVGAFASSYIPTTTASVTRAIESCSMPVGIWYNDAEGTMLAEALSGTGYDSAASINNRLLRLDNGGNTALHEMRRNNTDNTSRIGTVSNNVAQSSLVTGSWGSAVIVRMAYAYKNSDMAGCHNGGTVQTDTTSPDGMPTGLTQLRVGSAISSGAFGGHVRSIKYWRARLTNDQLREMTS